MFKLSDTKCVDISLYRIYSMYRSPSGTAVRVWLFSLSDGLKRVLSLKLQLFCTLAGLPPISSPPPTTSLPGEQRWRSFIDICRLFMLWPRGLAIRTRSLKLNFWLQVWRGRKERRRRQRERGGDGGMGREEERRPFKEARLMEVMIQREKRWNWGKWVRDEVYRVCWQREPRHIQTQGEREKRDAVNTYFPSEIEKSSECRHRAAFCLILQPKHHLTSNPHAQNIRTQLPSHQNKPSVLHPEMLQSSTRSLDKIYSRILRSKQS